MATKDKTKRNNANLEYQGRDAPSRNVSNVEIGASPSNKEGASLLQKLISSNALMNAFMGPQHFSLPEAVPESCSFISSDAASEKVLEEIGSTFDVEKLVNGIAADLELLLTSRAEDGYGDCAGEDDSLCNEANDKLSGFPRKKISNMQYNLGAEAEADKKEGPDNIDELATSSTIQSSSMNDSVNSTSFRIKQGISSAEQTLPFFSRTLAARLFRIKFLLYNERTSSSNNDTSFRSPSSESSAHFFTFASALLHALLKDDDSIAPREPDLMITLLNNLHYLPFEARKDVASIFNYLLVCGCVNSIGGLGDGTEEEFASSSSGENCSEVCIISYSETMVQFALYIKENFVAVISPIIAGHDIGNVQKTDESSPLNNKHNGDHSIKTTEVCATNTKKSPSTSSIVRTPDLALHCGSMLRSTLRHPSLYSELVSEKHAPRFVYPFLDSFVSQPNFEVASDALETFRLILGGGGGAVIPSFQSPSLPMTNLDDVESTMENIASSFLERTYTPIFEERFNPKLLSATYSNYIIRRVSLQLLSNLLLTRTNYNVMMRYISNRSNLITIMVLLRDASPHITFDAFNVFKVFVANPNKPPEVVRILTDNRLKLVKYLSGLHKDREATDEQFRDEKSLVISTLEAL